MKHLILTQEFMDREELNAPEQTAPELKAPLTIKNLRQQIQPLHQASVAQKLEWISRADFFFNKLKALDKLEKVSKLGSEYLAAYLLTKSAHYANYQPEHLKHTNFDQQKYLQTLATEIATESKCIQAYLRKEVNN